MNLFTCSACGGQVVRDEKLKKGICEKCGRINEYVFISYSSKNQHQADSFRHFFTEQGIPVWMAPYDIPVGEVYAHVITDALDNCSCMVLLLTRDSQESQFVCREVEAIISMNKPILPVQLETLELNKEFRFFLNTNQILSLTKPNLNDPKCQMLLDNIKRLVPPNKKPDIIIDDPPRPEDRKIGSKTIATICICLIIAVIAGGIFFGKSNNTPGKEDVVAEDNGAWKSNVLAFNPFNSDGSTPKVYDFDITRDQVVSVTFLDTVADAPTDAHDVSVNQNDSVLAWITQNGEKYDLYFAAEYGINASDAANYMFSYYSSLEKINFNNALHTDMSIDMSSMFLNCENLTELDLSCFNTSNVLNMAKMFQGCKNLKTLNISCFNTSNVWDMRYMFAHCSVLETLVLSHFDTSNVVDMEGMFYNCNTLGELNLSNFDTSNVTEMAFMFSKCENLITLNISSFNTSNVATMNAMFMDCLALETLNLNLSHFDTSNVTNMDLMFYNCINTKKLNLSHFDTSNVIKMSSMFRECRTLTALDISSFNTSSVTNMEYMFADCLALDELKLSNFDTSNVTNIEGMFYACRSLTELDISNFDTSNVTNMKHTFNNCTKLKDLNLGDFDTSSVQEYSSFMSAGTTYNGEPWENLFL